MFGSCLQILHAQYTEKEFGLRFRMMCAVEAIFFLFAAVVEPFVFLHAILFMESNREHASLFHKVVDWTFLIASGPIICCLNAIKHLAAAIIHPSIMYKQLD